MLKPSLSAKTTTSNYWEIKHQVYNCVYLFTDSPHTEVKFNKYDNDSLILDCIVISSKNIFLTLRPIITCGQLTVLYLISLRVIITVFMLMALWKYIIVHISYILVCTNALDKTLLTATVSAKHPLIHRNFHVR